MASQPVMPKISILSVSILFTMVSLFVEVSAQVKGDQILDKKAFRSPPDENHVHAWWHFVNKSITREGITKDLVAMKAQGVSEATILNISQFNGNTIGKVNVKFASPEYFKMFGHALHEANRLGIKIGAHNCDGWSESGGPWIGPEHSMKQYTWSKTLIKGGKTLRIKLPVPPSKLDFYRDVKVIAYRCLSTNSFVAAQPHITFDGKGDAALLTDGSPLSYIEIGKGQTVTFAFDHPFAAEKLQVHTRKLFAWSGTRQRVHLEVSCSDDGKTYRSVGVVEDSLVNQNMLLNLSPQLARYYRVRVKDIDFNGSAPIEVAELSLLPATDSPLWAPYIQSHQAKTVTVIARHYSDFYKRYSIPSGAIVRDSEVFDLSGRMLPDGTLSWSAPEGNWTILRFGYTTTAAVNAPATKEGEGLECDKMDTAALNLHFKNFPQKLIDAAGPYKGKTFKYLFVDSWECYYQNWTKGFEIEFQKRRGYSLIPYIPVLCGDLVTSQEASEAFLHDLRQTIGELIEYNYYKHLADLCHRNGLELHAESIYGGIFTPGIDVLRTNSYFDVPVTEFWAPLNASDTLLRYNRSNQINSTLPIHAAKMYNKRIIASEAYTGFANFSESPWDLKLWGDKGYEEGINQMVLHSYVHQPDDRRPGLTLGIYGASFNRNNTWWKDARPWLDFQARVQYLLQKGKGVADVLYYMGDKLPSQQAINKGVEIASGIRADFCNSDILLHQVKVDHRKLILPNGSTYRYIVCADSLISVPVLKKLQQFVSEGATLIGPKPVGSLSLFEKDVNDKKIRDLASVIWGKSKLGEMQFHSFDRGKVYADTQLQEIFKRSETPLDLTVRGADMSELMWTHRSTGDEEIYYLVSKNETNAVDLECKFRVAGSYPEVWDPVDGSVRSPGVYVVRNGTTTLPLHFAPKQSLFIVFKKGTQVHFDQVQDASGRAVFPADAERLIHMPRVEFLSKNVATIGADETRRLIFSGHAHHKTVDVSLKAPVVQHLQYANINLEFLDEPGIKPLKMTGFRAFQTFDDQRIRHYSGTARYSIDFNIPADLRGDRKKVMLGIGRFGSTAAISVNGGTEVKTWIPGREIDITSFVKTGKNHMVIQVTNPWRNRLLEKKAATDTIWTTAPPLPQTLMLLGSGISPPVYLKSLEEKLIEL